jgi:hypothetical protein
VSMRRAPQATLDISWRTASTHISGDAGVLPDPAPRISNRELRSTAAFSEMAGPALSPTSTNRTLEEAALKSLRAMADKESFSRRAPKVVDYDIDAGITDCASERFGEIVAGLVDTDSRIRPEVV